MRAALKIDPITTEIIRNAFISVAEDMNATLIRSAYNPIIYESKDCSVALIDENKRVLGQSAGLPIFLGNLEVCIELIEDAFGPEVWVPGDVWILNDSYMAGTHLNDVTIVSPIYWRDQLVGFSASRAHWMDIGAKDAPLPTDSTEIYQEGIRLGPIKIVDRGELRAEIVDILERNVRFPQVMLGDLNAQIAVARTGERRMAEVYDRYGIEKIHAAREAIFAQSAALDRAAVAAIPDGVYSAEGSLDNDGVTDDQVWIRMRVTVAGESMHIDLTETDDQVSGSINCGRAQALSAARVAFRRLINPDRPVTGGTFAPLTLDVREGSLLAAQRPAACQFYFTPLGLVIDLLALALAPVMPEKVAAASYGDSMCTYLYGMRDRKGRPFVHIDCLVGGWGAWSGSDGESSLINSSNGSIDDIPIEIMESRFPVHIRRYAQRVDSGGDGQWRGGNGTTREMEFEDDVLLGLWFERSKTPAWGLFGGEPGLAPKIIMNPGTEREVVSLKASRIPMRAGDVLLQHSGGGGGYGPPAARDAAAIHTDIREGRFSA
jgi:N-methylhydantoinase B